MVEQEVQRERGWRWGRLGDGGGDVRACVAQIACAKATRVWRFFYGPAMLPVSRRRRRPPSATQMHDKPRGIRQKESSGEASIRMGPPTAGGPQWQHGHRQTGEGSASIAGGVLEGGGRALQHAHAHLWEMHLDHNRHQRQLAGGVLGGINRPLTAAECSALSACK